MSDALISNLTEQRDLYKELAVKAADRITKLEATLDVALEALEKSMYPQKLQLDAIAKLKEVRK